MAESRNHHTTNQKGDPSTAPSGGRIDVLFVSQVGPVITFTILRHGCSLHGVPNAIAQDADFEALAVCIAATLEADTLALTFDNEDHVPTYVRFADKDPAVRGFQGQFMTADSIPLSTNPAPTLLSTGWDTDTGELYLTFSEEVQAYDTASNPYSTNGFDDGAPPDAAGNRWALDLGAVVVAGNTVRFPTDLNAYGVDAPPPSTVNVTGLSAWLRSAATLTPVEDTATDIPYTFAAVNTPPVPVHIHVDFDGMTAVFYWNQPVDDNSSGADAGARSLTKDIVSTGPATLTNQHGTASYEMEDGVSGAAVGNVKLAFGSLISTVSSDPNSPAIDQPY